MITTFHLSIYNQVLDSTVLGIAEWCNISLATSFYIRCERMAISIEHTTERIVHGTTIDSTEVCIHDGINIAISLSSFHFGSESIPVTTCTKHQILRAINGDRTLIWFVNHGTIAVNHDQLCIASISGIGCTVLFLRRYLGRCKVAISHCGSGVRVHITYETTIGIAITTLELTTKITIGNGQRTRGQISNKTTIGGITSDAAMDGCC